MLDVSASTFNYGRLQLAKEAAITVVITLTNADSVGVVLFSNQAKQLLLDTQSPGELVNATYANLTALEMELRNLVINPFVGQILKQHSTKLSIFWIMRKSNVILQFYF